VTSAAKDSANLRDRIVDEATRLFAKQGFAGTSVRELVEASNCTKPALYYYFDSKDALFLEIIETHSGAIENLMRLAIDGEGSLRQRIHGMADAFVAYAQANPDAMKLMIRIEGAPDDSCANFDFEANEESHMAIMTEIFARGATDGELRDGLDPTDCALALAGALHFQFSEAVMKSDWDRARYHRLIDLLFEGIAP